VRKKFLKILAFGGAIALVNAFIPGATKDELALQAVIFAVLAFIVMMKN
jgi:hypothetical protein